MQPTALRVFLWFFSRTLYRVTALNPDNVPGQGGALLVSNHVSFVDLLLILTSTSRMVRFLLPQGGLPTVVAATVPALSARHSAAARVGGARTSPGAAASPGGHRTG